MTQTAALPAELLHHPNLWRGSDLARTRHASVPSGFEALDDVLPGGGWPAGVLTEVLPAHEGIGELRLLGPALAALSDKGLRLAWIAPPHLPYAPAVTAAGIEPARLLIVRTKNEKDSLWAAEQALASNACGAVLAWLRNATYPQLRRLQLATENSEALALLFRPPQTTREASPAALRLAVSAEKGGLAVRLLKRRGAPLTQSVLLPALPFAQRKRLSGHDVDRPALPPAAARNPAARIAFA